MNRQGSLIPFGRIAAESGQWSFGTIVRISAYTADVRLDGGSMATDVALSIALLGKLEVGRKVFLYLDTGSQWHAIYAAAQTGDVEPVAYTTPTPQIQQVVVGWNADQVDGFDFDQPLLRSSSPIFDRLALTEPTLPPLIVSSSAQVDGLNVQLWGGKTTSFLTGAAIAFLGTVPTGYVQGRSLTEGNGVVFTDAGAGNTLGIAVKLQATPGLLLNASGLAVKLQPLSGLDLAASGVAVNDSIAGDGLGISNKTIFVDGSDGIEVGVNGVAVNATVARDSWPVSAINGLSGGGTLDPEGVDFWVNLAYDFEWEGVHSFIQDIQLDADLDFLGGTRAITTSNGDLVLAPDGEFLLQPVAGITRWQWGAGKSLESDNYASQSAGWGISYGLSGGHADFRSMYADSMHVQAFIADIYEAMVGAIIITKSRAKLSRNFTIPFVSLASRMYLEDLEGLEGIALFSDLDYVRLRIIDSGGGGMLVTDAWGTVTGYLDEGGGEQSWIFQTISDGGAPQNSRIFAGSIALDYGKVGGIQGVWEATVLDQAGAPYSQVKTWAGNPWTPGNFTTHLRVGNLDGISGVGLEWGMWVGQNTTTDYLLLSDQHLEAHGLRISLYDATNETIRLDPLVPSIALGATIPLAFDDPGIWMGRHSDGTYRLSINQDGDQYLQWTWNVGADRYRLNLAGDIWLNNSPGMAGTNFGGAIHVGDNGLIEMGDGSKISLGAGSFFEMLAGGKAEIGTQGSGNYFGYVNGAMRLEGALVVSDGGDFLPAEYRPASISASFETSFQGGTTWNLWGALPYGDDGGYVAGRMETANGNVYTILSTATVDSAGSRYAKIAVRKTRLAGDFTVGSIAYPNTIYIPGTSCIICRAFTEAQWSALSEDERNNRVVIADAYLSADFSDVVSVSFRAESGISIIGPDFIRTPSLSALSANLGILTVTNGDNALWINHGTNGIVLAAGPTAGGIAAATFKLFENGNFAAGGGSNFISWQNPDLFIQGAIKATTGELVDLSVTGQLSINDNAEHDSGLYMNGGRIYWNNVSGVYNSYLSNYKIHVQDKATGSVVEIGNASNAEGGLIDLVMFQSGGTAWRHGISVKDHGNKLSNVSALFHGESMINGAFAVDRIFDARTEAGYGSLSDGYYAEMAAASTWDDFNTAGVPFKGVHLAGGPVAMFNQHAGGADAPVVWATSQNANRSLLISEMGADGQKAFRVIRNNYAAGVGLDADQTSIQNVEFVTAKMYDYTGGSPDVSVSTTLGALYIRRLVDAGNVYYFLSIKTGDGIKQTLLGNAFA